MRLSTRPQCLPLRARSRLPQRCMPHPLSSSSSTRPVTVDFPNRLIFLLAMNALTMKLARARMAILQTVAAPILRVPLCFSAVGRDGPLAELPRFCNGHARDAGVCPRLLGGSCAGDPGGTQKRDRISLHPCLPLDMAGAKLQSLQRQIHAPPSACCDHS